MQLDATFHASKTKQLHSPSNFPKSDEKATSETPVSSVSCSALNARGSSADDFEAGAGAGAGAFAGAGAADAAARLRLAATEFDANFLPSATFVGS